MQGTRKNLLADDILASSDSGDSMAEVDDGEFKPSKALPDAISPLKGLQKNLNKKL